MDKAAILEAFRALQSHLLDFRPSKDPTGTLQATGGVLISTREEIQAVQASEHKQQFLALLDDLLQHVPGTEWLKRNLREISNSFYDSSLPTGAVLACFGIAKQDWTFFDPSRIEADEREILEGSMQAVIEWFENGNDPEGTDSLARETMGWIQEFRERYEQPTAYCEEYRELTTFFFA